MKYNPSISKTRATSAFASSSSCRASAAFLTTVFLAATSSSSSFKLSASSLCTFSQVLPTSHFLYSYRFRGKKPSASIFHCRHQFCNRVTGRSCVSLSSASFQNSAKVDIVEAATESKEILSREEQNVEFCSKMNAGDKLDRLRCKMVECGVDVYLIPSDDPHLSEYVPSAYMRRAYLTDFHGSAGTALVTLKDAYLWTDSRYFNEASLRLDPKHWTLMKQGQPKVPTITKFLSKLAIDHYSTLQSQPVQERIDALSSPLRVGIDPYVHSARFVKDLTEEFENASKDVVPATVMENPTSTLQADNGLYSEKRISESPVLAVIDTLDGKSNLVDSIWEERPEVPKNPFRVHPIKYAGMTVNDKVLKIRSEMTEKKVTLTVFGALDEVAYLLNLRCMGDIETCPVGIAYATVSLENVTLYCDKDKVQLPQVVDHLKQADVIIKSYEDIVSDIQSHLSLQTSPKVWLDNTRSNYAVSRVIPSSSLLDAQNPITPMKACKNSSEMEGMRRAHIVDGAAMAQFMAWLEHTIVHEGRSVSEVEIDTVLTGYRAQQPGFCEVSFPTIAGVGSNGAIVHYRAAEGTELLKYLDRTQPILIDSGGQYEYGTTDVTRTWFFGENPSEEFREMYTRVLKGNIGVDCMIFPENTPGFVLDVFARKALWEIRKDYGHGTGHGVGAALNVHEGPHSISPRWSNAEVLKKGMVTSNEPGYYDDGHFGIRIENLLEIIDMNDESSATSDNGNSTNGEERLFKKQKTDSKQYLKFAKLTMIPIQKNLIKLDLMTDAELDWLDTYHQEVLEKVSPLLEDGSPAMKWLVKSCEKIHR